MAREAAALAPVAVLATRSRHPRAVPPETVVEAFGATAATARAVGSVAQGVDLALAMAAEDDVILATGSLFTAAEARELMLAIVPEIYE
jgi:folylpolyglutamate synthase/dihydropteroate synthase